MSRCPHCGADQAAGTEICTSCRRSLPQQASADAFVPVRAAMAALSDGAGLAAADRRDDLERQLRLTEARLAEQPVPVVVAGEFKRGKSTLVNALLQRAVCPVDADLVTAVPTTVYWAETPQLTAYSRPQDGEQLVARTAPLEELELLITERADDGDPLRERFVEVGLPHRMLRSGLRLIDTPGVGGLDSAHGFLTLGALRNAQGVLFVTDAAQELTAPELEFLTTAVGRCSRTALVITKIDLYRHWRRIADLDRGHLERAGLDVPVIAVSSFLRLRAGREQQLNAESGFAELISFLATDVVASCRAEAARSAAGEIGFVAAQVARPAAAEQAVLSAPDQAAAVVDELDQARVRAGHLASPTATWQQTLADGIADLVADVEHDLTGRLRTVLREAEEMINSDDPRDSWADTETWLRRQVAIVTVENRDLLTERARQLATEVADQFDLQAEDQVELDLIAPGASLEAIEFAPESTLKMPGGKLAPLMTAARSSFYLPMMAGGVAAAVLEVGPVVHLSIAGISIALGAGIGRKIIADERKRQLTYRQQQAMGAVRKFVDEVAFLLNKQTRDGLRATQRQLRDDFGERALLMHRSATEAFERARRAQGLTPDERRVRAAELAATRQTVDQVRGAVRELVGTDG